MKYPRNMSTTTSLVVFIYLVLFFSMYDILD